MEHDYKQELENFVWWANFAYQDRNKIKLTDKLEKLTIAYMKQKFEKAGQRFKRTLAAHALIKRDYDCFQSCLATGK